MATKTRVTQHDIAKHLGISQITVSRALSGHPSVTAEMRERVEEAALDLGYRPHASASAMRRGKHDAYGLITSTDPHSASFPMEMMWYLHDAAAKYGKRLIIGRLPPEQFDDKVTVPKFLREWCVDGLIAHFPEPPNGQLNQLLDKAQIPLVSINSDIPYSIMPDDFGAGKKAVERLIALGHKRIAYVGPIDGHSSASERLRGYKHALTEHGIEPQVFNIGDWHKRYNRKQTALAILNGPNRPTALFCYGRWIALNFLVAAETLGMHVPDDLSIITTAQVAFPNAGIDVTIERFPLEAMAEAAVKQLLRIENDEVPEAIPPIPFESCHGETLGPPPRANN